MTIIRTRRARAALTACVLFGLSTVASAQVITAEQAAKLLRYLEAPRLRPTHLEFYRSQARSAQPELAEVLDIDASMVEKLLRLLAEQKLATEVRSLQRFSTAIDASGGSRDADSSATVTTLDRERAALEALLGPAVFRRYLKYLSTVLGRRPMVTFDAGLGELRLNRTQKEQLVQLYAEQARVRRRGRYPNPTGVQTPESFELLRNGDQAVVQRFYFLSNLRNYEDRLANETQLQIQLLRATSAFLSNAQQAALQKFAAPYLESLEHEVRVLRQLVGLDPDQSLDSIHPRPKQPQPLQGDVQWTLWLCGHAYAPQIVRFQNQSGRSVSFRADDGLFVDATATAYDNGRIHALLTLFEQDEGGRYRIGTLDANGPLQPASVAASRSNDDTAAGCLSNIDSNSIVNIVWPGPETVITGRRGYALTPMVSGTLQ